MELPIQLQKESGIPLYIQLEQQIRLLVRQRVLAPGDLMPTTRSLAVDLEINSNTVARVYRDLQQEGLLILKRGVGTFVAQGSAAKSLHAKDMRGIEMAVDKLVHQSRRLGVTPVELFQLIERRWEVESDGKG